MLFCLRSLRRRRWGMMEAPEIETAKLEQHLDFMKSITIIPNEWLKEKDGETNI